MTFPLRYSLARTALEKPLHRSRIDEHRSLQLAFGLPYRLGGKYTLKGIQSWPFDNAFPIFLRKMVATPACPTRPQNQTNCPSSAPSAPQGAPHGPRSIPTAIHSCNTGHPSTACGRVQHSTLAALYGLYHPNDDQIRVVGLNNNKP